MKMSQMFLGMIIPILKALGSSFQQQWKRKTHRNPARLAHELNGLLKWVIFQKKYPHPHNGRHIFYPLPPPPPQLPTGIRKLLEPPLPSGFPSSKTPPSIWLCLKLLDIIILIYTQCTRFFQTFKPFYYISLNYHELCVCCESKEYIFISSCLVKLKQSCTFCK